MINMKDVQVDIQTAGPRLTYMAMTHIPTGQKVCHADYKDGLSHRKTKYMLIEELEKIVND